MDALEELEEVLTLDQAHELADFDSSMGGVSSTQQLLDDLLGRFEEDDSGMFIAHGLSPELNADSDSQ